MASGNLKYLNDDTLAPAITNGAALVYFFAEWCGPCKMLGPIIQDLAEEMGNQLTIAKVDIDGAQRVTNEYGITSVPTMIFFKNGKEERRVVGLRDKEALKSLIQPLLG